jgi:hypothetical protein
MRMRKRKLDVSSTLGYFLYLVWRGRSKRAHGTVYQKHRSLLIRKKMYRG